MSTPVGPMPLRALAAPMLAWQSRRRRWLCRRPPGEWPGHTGVRSQARSRQTRARPITWHRSRSITKGVAVRPPARRDLPDRLRRLRVGDILQPGVRLLMRALRRGPEPYTRRRWRCGDHAARCLGRGGGGARGPGDVPAAPVPASSLGHGDAARGRCESGGAGQGHESRGRSPPGGSRPDAAHRHRMPPS
jgi:hypothetical protein